MQAHDASFEPTMALPDRELRILLVDDEPDITAMLARAVVYEWPKATVAQAHDATEGGVRVAEGNWDVIVSDYRMPGKDGVMFLRDARIAHERTIRILLTAFPDQQVSIDAINHAHVDRFLTKPIAMRDFIEAVREGWNAKRAEEARASAFARALSGMKTELDAERDRHSGSLGPKQIASPFRGQL